jgi:hypothetical protein
MRKFLMLLMLLVCPALAEATTYYVRTGVGNDNNSCGTAAIATPTSNAKATMSSAWGCLNAGDTLIVGNGTYTSPGPPNSKQGTVGNEITIQAENEGQVTFSGNHDIRNVRYVTWVGMKFVGTFKAISIRSTGAGSRSEHLTFRRVGIQCTDTGTNDNACVEVTDGSHHNLFEDSWVFGGGRYTMMFYGGTGGNPPNSTADFNTVRRVVLRQGPSGSTSGNPQAALSVYTASDNIIENVIAINGVQGGNSSRAAFYLTAHECCVRRNKYFGVMAIDNIGKGWYMDEAESNNELRNSVLWDSSEAGIEIYCGSFTCTGLIIDHNTIGSNSGNGIQAFSGSSTVRSNIFYQNTGTALHASGGSISENWNDLFGNGGTRSGVSTGANSITSNPLLQYIGRVEAGTPCITAGEGGTQCGANVTKRYQDGTLTGTDLWPWPNEARMKAEMCISGFTTRGFCNTAQTFTEYVWAYAFGNSNPYPGGGDPPPDPPPPAGGNRYRIRIRAALDMIEPGLLGLAALGFIVVRRRK